MNFESAITLLKQRIIEWYEISIKYIPNIVIAALILVMFFYFAKSVKHAAKRVLPKIFESRSVIDLLETFSFVLINVFGLFAALEVLGLEKTVTSILAGAGVIGIALGFAFQEIASNFVSGVFISIKEPYKIGDIVEIDDFVGEVTGIELRTTHVTTFQGLEIHIPNKDMFTKPVTNYTSTPKRRIDLQVGVSYEDDLELVEEVTKNAIKGIPNLIENMDPEVFFHEFGDSSINLTVRVWIKYFNEKAYLESRHHAVILIKQSFDKHGITIPFPIRTIVKAN